MTDPLADRMPGPGRPRQMLRRPEHLVDRPRFPVIDAHNHLGSVFGGDWAQRPVDELLAAMDAAGVVALVDLDGGFGERLDAAIARWQTRIRLGSWCSPVSIRSVGRPTPTSGATEAARLRDSVRRGARGLKVWKTLGLHARDPAGPARPAR